MSVKDEDGEGFTGKRNLTNLGENPISRALAFVQDAMLRGQWTMAWTSMLVLVDTPGNVDLRDVGTQTISEKERSEQRMLSWQGNNLMETSMHRQAWYGQAPFFTWTNSYMEQACRRLFAEIQMKLKVFKYFEDNYGGIDANKEAQRL